MSSLYLFIWMVIAFMCTVLTGCDGSAYICTGPQSEVYHSTKRCKGLRRCSGDLRKLSINEAENIGRRECKWCY